MYKLYRYIRIYILFLNYNIKLSARFYIICSVLGQCTWDGTYWFPRRSLSQFTLWGDRVDFEQIYFFCLPFRFIIVKLHPEKNHNDCSNIQRCPSYKAPLPNLMTLVLLLGKRACKADLGVIFFDIRKVH